MDILSKLTVGSGRATPHLQDEVPAGESRHKTSWTVPYDGTVEKVTLWAVPGSQDSLRLRPVIKTAGGEENLLDYADDGEHFVTGEPDGEPHLMSESVHQGDEIQIVAENESTDYAYRYRALITVDYAGGAKRVLTGVLN